MNTIHCPMIHGGINIDLKANSQLGYNQCCLSTTPLTFVKNDKVDWHSTVLTDNRVTNNREQWLPGCWECERLEKVGEKSFRQAMIEKFGVKENLSGPQRIDLLFDRSCNLACRSCGPRSSTLWTKHLKDNHIEFIEFPQVDNVERIKNILQNLNLENVRMIQFCGGETLLGNTYWETAKFLAEIIPDAKHKVELGFQTNCTQSIDPRWFEVIDKFQLVKLMLSIDGIGDKFEYLRWPADWNKTVDNLFHLRESLPSNVMFVVQETTSCLNLFYYNEVRNWVRKNFNANREGDPVDHSTQLVMHQYLDVRNITQEYMDALSGRPEANTIGKNWQENPSRIQLFINQTEKFDKIRNQDWKKTFPEVAEFYRRYF